ncbi:LytS/YhcK type 5TM receptor domain-containing protein [Fusibacter sp. 3D3]|uniref:LytS/YhcK type 5TM receptor domain-containing protein n=1 Tax=Fusibacter sp. 3D3 TaxID=1048380 RepID=UPI000853D085|nr:LytS/YhcK type 5TM receptor domain-containing protein [Fusibacter sp. 3D3]GAU79642.1 autolysis histidine kinase LytS [Fusibacter sp. 3D3]
MLELLIQLVYRVGLIIMIGLVFSKTRAFKNIIEKREMTFPEKITMGIIFALLSILGTYSGIKYQGAIVNTRVIGVAVGGLLGGPVVGLIAGIIAGGHRFLIDIGGFTALACGISTCTEGIVAGALSKRFRASSVKIPYALAAGVLLESLQMLILVLIAKPFEDAMNLMWVISFPMILVNSCGIALFVSIISNIQSLSGIQAKYRARQALLLADKTTQSLREGLNRDTAKLTAEQILSATDFDAIAITNNTEILTHVGAESEHHKAGLAIMTQLTKIVLKSGEVRVAQSKEAIGCPSRKCHLNSAVIVPIWEGDVIKGTLKFYRTTDVISDLDIEIAKGLSNILSTQLRITDLERQSKLALNAEIKALQAQINPHFLFNSLNVVISLIRTDPQKAREVLLDLSEFFGKNMQSLKGEIAISDELVHVEKYISVSKARFGEKVRVQYDIRVDQSTRILPLLIQPIVENAVLHGILQKAEGGLIKVSIKNIEGLNQEAFLEIEVLDDGMGMTEEKLNMILSGALSESVGFVNVMQRIEKHYGSKGSFKIESQVGQGTCVRIILPMKRE